MSSADHQREEREKMSKNRKKGANKNKGQLTIF